MNPPTTPPAAPGLTPASLANQLFSLAIPQCNNDWHEAGRQVAIYLSETIVHVVYSLSRDDSVCAALLKSAADAIASAKRPVGVIGAPSAPKSK
jgi:hypothetical protein